MDDLLKGRWDSACIRQKQVNEILLAFPGYLHRAGDADAAVRLVDGGLLHLEPTTVHTALRGKVVPLSLRTEIAFLPQKTEQAVLPNVHAVLPEQLSEVAN